ncbi:MAG: 23S rRNA (guanosine(2251)-2'-O)-methyltransferase RlmB [Bacteroidota bacterium]
MKKEDLIFGVYPVLEAMKSEVNFSKLFVLKGSNHPKVNEIASQLERSGVSISFVPQEKLDKLTRSNHQGIVAMVSPITFADLDEMVASALAKKDKKPLFLVLDQISDVRNFGAIIRTAECTHVDGIIIQKKGGAPVSGDTVKTSAGAIFKTPICKVDHIKDAIFYLQGSNIKVVAATEKTEQSIYDTDLNTPIAIVMGSEGKGVSKSVLNLVDERAALPLLGEINSLNVSVACGAFLYEVIRQRGN